MKTRPMADVGKHCPLRTAANSAGYVAAMTDRIAVARQAGRKVFTLQTLPPFDHRSVTDGQAGRVLAACATAGAPLLPPQSRC